MSDIETISGENGPMAEKKIKLMISSRCTDQFDGRSLSDIRRDIKKEIESEKFFDKDIFEVWINEDNPSERADHDSWNICIKQVRKADLFLVLYNGNAGWVKPHGSNGICHEEFATAYRESPGKVIGISILDNQDKTWEDKDKRFQRDFENANLFRSESPVNYEKLIASIKEAIHNALIDIAHQGAREIKKSKYCTGPSLDWSRLDFITPACK